MKLFRREPEARSHAPSDRELATIAKIRSQGGTIMFGVPTRCPECLCYGLVDHVDQAAGTSTHRCPACRATWTISRQGLRMSRGATPASPSSLPAVPAAVLPVGDGVLVRNLTAA